MGALKDAAGNNTDNVQDLYAYLPAAAEHVFSLAQTMRTEGKLSLRLIELTRLRIAFHNQCRQCASMRYQSAVEDGMDDDSVCALAAPQVADNLSPAEKLAIEYADRFATDHLSITPDFYEQLREYFSEPEIVQLGINCAFNLGIGRMVSTWRTTGGRPDLEPDSDGIFRPWNIADPTLYPDQVAGTDI